MHLDSEVIVDLLEGRTEASRIPALNAHIEQCSSCSVQLEQWRRMFSLLARTHLTGAPHEVLRNAGAIFQPDLAAQPTMRQIIASLVFDSLAQPTFAGARGGADARQMVLRAENFDIHVKILGDPRERQMIGQILARGEGALLDGAWLRLLQNDECVGMTAIDQFGGFLVDDVPQGSLSIQIVLPHLTLIGALDLV